MVGFAESDAKPRERETLPASEGQFHMAGLLAISIATQIGQKDSKVGAFGRREINRLRLPP